MSEMKPVACDVVDREGGTVATRVTIEYADDLLRQWEHRDSKKANFLYDERVVAELQIARAEYAGRARLAETRLIEAEQRAERAEARVAELEADARRLDYLESKVRHFGNGLTEPRETTLFFGWQQSQEQETFPGLRAAIDQQLAKGGEG